MKIHYNFKFLLPGFHVVNLFGVLCVRGDRPLGERTINHESIHTEQWKELLYVLFLLWYVIEWLIRLVQYRGSHAAYRNISFEREAYSNEGDMDYLSKRKKYSFLKYIKKNGND